jgi:hypothetical protein
MLVCILFAVFLLWSSFTSGCYLSFEVGNVVETVDVVCDLSLTKESLRRNYHYIMFSGNYTNHTYLRTWTEWQNLNISFYTDRSMERRMKGNEEEERNERELY